MKLTSGIQKDLTVTVLVNEECISDYLLALEGAHR
jgi:hypothetical protein